MVIVKNRRQGGVGQAIINVVLTQVPRPKGNMVLRTKRLCTRKIGEHDEMVKHKCRFVAQGFRRITILHYTGSSSPITTVASISTALAAGALSDMEIYRLDFEQAYLTTEVDTEIYVELPVEYREFPNAVGSIVQSSRCWN